MLIGADGRPYASRTPGTLGGHRRSMIYGRLDCPGALRWIARGHYLRHRVFFADEATARAARYRPCAVCMQEAYRRWREQALVQSVPSFVNGGIAAPDSRTPDPPSPNDGTGQAN